MAIISYVLPVYKAEKYLETALASIRAQGEFAREILLVDDGSPDGSALKCDLAALEDPSVVVIHRKNAGSGYARNAGLNAAEGKYVCFMDPDDALSPTLAADNLRLAEETSAEVVVFGHHIIYENRDGSVKRSETALPALSGVLSYKEFIDNLYTFWQGNPSTVWGKLFSREYIERYGLRFTNQSVGQDAIYCLDVYASPFSRVAFAQKPYYEHVLREGSAVDRYHPDRYLSELNIAERLEALLRDKGLMDTPCRFLAAERYMRVLCLEGANAVKPESGMRFCEKARRIRALAAMPRIAWAVKALPLGYFKRDRQKLVQLALFKLRLFGLFLCLKKIVQRRAWT